MKYYAKVNSIYLVTGRGRYYGIVLANINKYGNILRHPSLSYERLLRTKYLSSWSIDVFIVVGRMRHRKRITRQWRLD